MASLPSKYTQLEYIESNGSQRLNTGYYTTTTPRFRMEMDIELFSNGYIFGAQSFSDKNGFKSLSTFFSANDEIALYAIEFDFKSVRSFLPRFVLKCDFSANGSKLYADDTLLITSSTPASLDSSLPLYLFCQYEVDMNGDKVSTGYIKMRLYYCRIYSTAGSLVSEFIPCKNSSGKTGLYDTVKGKFLTDQNGGNFTAGPEFKETSAMVSLLSSPASGGKTSGGGSYEIGTEITVNAAASSGYKFVRWTDGGTSVSTADSYTFTVSKARTLTAVFEQVKTYSVSLTASPDDGGTVSGSGTYSQNTAVSVNASAFSGYKFAGWTENNTKVSDNASYSFKITGNRTLTATFEKEDTGGVATKPPTTVITGGIWKGLGRRELYVDARDLQSDADPENPLTEQEYIELLIARGKLKLTENQLVQSFEAVVRTLNPTYVYGRDFFLGDTITVTDDRLGVTADAVVQAAKWEIDEEGERLTLTMGYSLPTLYEILKRKAGK